MCIKTPILRRVEVPHVYHFIHDIGFKYIYESIKHKLFEGLFEVMQKQPIYNNRNKVHVKPSKISKKHYFFQKSNHFYDFFEQKVIIMTKK